MPSTPPLEAELAGNFSQLRGEHPLAVYIDLKSPYAYLAIDPTRAMAAAAGVAVDWRPFTLDIPSYLGSAKLDRKGEVEIHLVTPRGRRRADGGSRH